MTKPDMLRLSIVAAALCLGVPAAQAHDLWLNAAVAQGDGHGAGDPARSMVVTSAGWGHAPMPLAEFLPGARISAYRLIDPDGGAHSLPFDPDANADLRHDLPDAPGITVQSGDAMMRRVILDDSAPQGAWRAHLGNPARVWTTWIDADGNRHSAARFADEIADAEQIVSTALSVRDATAWWAHGDWSEPAPVQDIALEMLPASNPGALRTGDTLDVALFWNGAPLAAGHLPLFTALGDGPDAAVIVEDGAGGAQFTLPAPGYWVLRAMIEVPVDEAGAAYSDLAGRIDAVRLVTTLALRVAP